MKNRYCLMEFEADSLVFTDRYDTKEDAVKDMDRKIKNIKESITPDIEYDEVAEGEYKGICNRSDDEYTSFFVIHNTDPEKPYIGIMTETPLGEEHNGPFFNILDFESDREAREYMTRYLVMPLKMADKEEITGIIEKYNYDYEMEDFCIRKNSGWVKDRRYTYTMNIIDMR